MLILILAGGTGTRLWPISRQSNPKQLLPLIGSKTMMQATIERVLPIVSMDNIFVVTNEEYGQMIQEEVSGFNAKNVVVEPSAKGTAPCIGLSAVHMRQMDADAVMASLHADHFIADEEGFRKGLQAAEAVAREGYLVTLGIEPTGPETGYGYIKRGELVEAYEGYKAFNVDEFLEKPDLETAQKFVDSGEYYWNSGIFIWQISTLLEEFEKHLPDTHAKLMEIDGALNAGEVFDTIWESIGKNSIDVGIMEQAKKVAVVPVDIGWTDVGSWSSIHEINARDENNNVVMGVEHIAIDTEGCLVRGEKRLIATIGLEDLIIVDSGDAILVCAKDRVQDVKQVVQWLEKNGRDDLL